MNLPISFLLLLRCTTSIDAFAFCGSLSPTSTALPSLPSSKVVAETTTTGTSNNNRNGIAVVGTFFAGMGLAAQVAFATPLPYPVEPACPPTAATTLSSSTSPTVSSLLLSDSTNIFELPSYADAKKNKSIEVDVESANRATMEKSRQKRFDTTVDVAGKDRSNNVRKDEIKEEDRMERMMRLADEERKEKLAREKEESKANRWNTFK